MDALPFIKEMLYIPALRVFLSSNVPDIVQDYNRSVSLEIISFLNKIKFDLLEDTEANKVDLIMLMQLEARQIGCASRMQTCGLVTYWMKTLFYNINDLVSCNYLKQKDEFEHKGIDPAISSLNDVERIEALLPHNADSSNRFTDDERRQAFFLIAAFPSLRELKEPYKILKFLLEVTKELDILPRLICNACGQPLVLLLIGSLLPFKPRAYNTWNKVKVDLDTINKAENHLEHVLSYCYDELPDFLKQCFLYLACYPIDYEIPARSLTEIWIAEGFVQPEKEETIAETANNYLEQLVQRSLLCVSKRSFQGTIKSCRVHRSIHEYAIRKSYKEGFLAANRDWKEIKSISRVAINHDNKIQNPILLDRKVVSFLAFNVDRNDMEMSDMLLVVELRKSSIPKKPLVSMVYLRYLGLRGSNIHEIPPTVILMKFLETLDVRDTSIKTLPESLWTISTLRNVYANSSPQIQGPPRTTNTENLQILKTIAVPMSWLENLPEHFLINLRKLALSNRNNLCWISISKLLSHMVSLLSMTIISDIVPSEFVDTRAFPNLVTVKSIKFVGKWSSKNLIIDNVKFPTNLTKLTLTNSSLKEDPMPSLERLVFLKYLSLEDGAYIGKKMVCSEKGFPQLQFLQLYKLKNLETWEVKPMGMSQLTTLRVLQCRKLKNLPDLEHTIGKANLTTLQIEELGDLGSETDGNVTAYHTTCSSMSETQEPS